MASKFPIIKKTIATSNGCFYFGIRIDAKGLSDKTGTYTITPYLAWNGSTKDIVTGNISKNIQTTKQNSCTAYNPGSGNEFCNSNSLKTYVANKSELTRFRHYWKIYFYVDNKKVKTDTYNTFNTSLPALYAAKDIDNKQTNNRLNANKTSSGVESTGHLHMLKGVYYQWAAPYTFKLTNDGTTHSFAIVMENTGGILCPQWCPSGSGGADKRKTNSTIRFTVPNNQTITPAKATVTINKPNAWWDYTVSWTSAANATKYHLYRRVTALGTTKAVDTFVKTYTAAGTYIPNEDARHCAKPGSKVTYYVVTESRTGNKSSQSVASATVTIGGGIKVWANNTWHDGEVYVWDGVKWHKALDCNVWANNTWHHSVNN